MPRRKQTWTKNELDGSRQVVQILPLELVCSNCGTVLYSGFELKSPKEVLRGQKNCATCSRVLSVHDFWVDILKSQMSS